MIRVRARYEGDAIQLPVDFTSATEADWSEVVAFVAEHGGRLLVGSSGARLFISGQDEWPDRVEPGEWIVADSDGMVLYPDDVFRATWEPLD